MNILLINPENHSRFRGLKRAVSFIRRKASLPPLGLLTVAGMGAGEWTMRVLGGSAPKLTKEDLVWADFAYMSGSAARHESAREIVARCEEAGVNVVAGGPLFFCRI